MDEECASRLNVPELPEVETTVRLLRQDLIGRRIQAAEAPWLRSLGGMSRARFARSVIGCRVTKLWRRGKFVVMDLERQSRAAGHLIVHLRMSGRLFVAAAREPREDWTRVRLKLDRGALVFVDVRKFGRFLFRPSTLAVFEHLGPEPLSDEFTRAWLREALRSRKRQLKPLLLDQSFLAGLGNIYVDESLHSARLHPEARCDRVSVAAADRLHEAIRDTLEAAIEREGSSFDTFYRTPAGQPGAYQHQFRVYGRAGKPCPHCQRPILRIVVSQRGTHLCTRCQPRPRGGRIRAR